MLAKEAGICYAAVALATDYDCWRDTGNYVCVSEVLETFKKNIKKVSNLIISAVPAIANENWDVTIMALQVRIYSN